MNILHGKAMMIKQGASAIATPAKQSGLGGIIYTEAVRLKKCRHRHVYMDAYCGSGRNVIGDEMIDGSPITTLKSVFRAWTAFNDSPPRYSVEFIFGDITDDRATEILPQEVEVLQRELGLPVDSNSLSFETKFGAVSMPIHYRQMDARDFVMRITEMLQETNRHVTLTIDPNGPKDIPYDDLHRLWKLHKDRVTLIFHVSATTYKRVAAARKSGIEFAPMPDHLRGLVELFTDNPRGWIRRPVGADQWVLLMLTMYEPRHGWGNDFLRLSTSEGRTLLDTLSMTNKQKRIAA